jgi:hypothetical protein
VSDWPALAAGIRSGAVSAEAVTRWLCAQPALWFVVEGEFDADGQPLAVRPVVVHHPSGATVSLLFTDETRARRYVERAADRPEPLAVVPAAPQDGFEALLALPIDGITINPGDVDHLNAGRRQLEVLAERARRSP